ncbi:MAG: cytochrome d ubiquinol oxidase subunit II [Chlorobi bacterium]|nr:cytochrome d ubiquinol oxidase subunit II [Chlorobiota bacterium]
MSYEALQMYWWGMIALLGAALVFLLFVQGGQTLFYKLSGNEREKTVLINLFGHKWELTFTTLVTFGGAFFASFPLFYATSFGGAYWVWYIILFAFILQAVSYEFRSKIHNFLGQKTYEAFLYFNGVIAPFLLGVAVSTFFTGNYFSVEKTRLVKAGSNVEAVIAHWETPWYGLEALWNTHQWAFLQNIALGLAVFFLARVNALLYVRKNVDDPEILARSRKELRRNAVLFLVFFLFWLIRLMFISGFAVEPGTGEVFMQKGKYFRNLVEMPVVALMLAAGIAAVLVGLYKGIFRDEEKAFWYTAAGTVLTVLSIFFLAGYNHTAYYPSLYDLQSSLTIANSSSSRFTLIVMGYVSLMVPFVVAYIAWAWRALDRHKLSEENIEREPEKY